MGKAFSAVDKYIGDHASGSAPAPDAAASEPNLKAAPEPVIVRWLSLKAFISYYASTINSAPTIVSISRQKTRVFFVYPERARTRLA